MFGLESIAPKFLVPSKRISVLYEPAEFYSYLRTRILAANSRIFLASLYLGRSEQELIDVLAEALHKNEKLHVYVLVDALRGTREAPNACSASLLAPLAKQFPTRVQLSMYKTPKLGRLATALLPKRIVEGVGLQHMKLYGFDNEIILSGANLSNDYFTNRQDRYISIKDDKVTDWFHSLYLAVSNMSHRLLPANNEQGFTLIARSRSEYRSSRASLASLLKPNIIANRGFQERDEGLDTQIRHDHDERNKRSQNDKLVEVYPVGQFTPLGLGNEQAAMECIIRAASSPKYGWLLTAGYFNIAPSLGKMLVKASGGEVIVASPKANGFYQSQGISGQLPHFYEILTRRFMEQIPGFINNTSSEGNMVPTPITVRPWERGTVNTPGGWSYHAKGIWLWKHDPSQPSSSSTSASNPTTSADDASAPFLTYIGSSNFTRRSYLHDIEAGAILLCGEADPKSGLGADLKKEKNHLKQYCGAPLTAESISPKVTRKNKFLLWLFGDRL